MACFETDNPRELAKIRMVLSVLPPVPVVTSAGDAAGASSRRRDAIYVLTPREAQPSVTIGAGDSAEGSSCARYDTYALHQPRVARGASDVAGANNSPLPRRDAQPRATFGAGDAAGRSSGGRGNFSSPPPSGAQEQLPPPSGIQEPVAFGAGNAVGPSFGGGGSVSPLLPRGLGTGDAVGASGCRHAMLGAQPGDYVATADLVIHDRSYTPEQILSHLKVSKNDIDCLRLDSNPWNGSQLNEVLLQLRDKCVNELIIVNTLYPKKMLEFEVDILENTNRVNILRFCFFKVQLSYCYRLAESMTVLDLSHCVLDEQDLYEYSARSSQLRELHLGFHSDNIRLHSKSLRILQIWMSRLDKVDVEHAPNLVSLTVSASPRHNSLLSVVVRHSLKMDRLCFNVSNQALSINGTSLKTGNLSCPNVKFVSVGLKFSEARETMYLLNTMKCLPKLERLTIWRIDDLANNEKLNAALCDWLRKLAGMPCLGTLDTFKFEVYKGGYSETSLVCAVLELSSSIKYLSIESDGSDEDVLRKLEVELKKVKQRFPHHVTWNFQMAVARVTHVRRTLWGDLFSDLEKILNSCEKPKEYNRDLLLRATRLVEQMAREIFEASRGWILMRRIAL